VEVVEEPEFLAKTVVRDPEELGGNKAHPAYPGCDPDTGGNGREGCRERNVPDQVEIFGAPEHLCRFDKDPGHAAKPAVGIDDDGKDRTNEDDETRCRCR
jgi:hypothetical protein